MPAKDPRTRGPSDSASAIERNLNGFVKEGMAEDGRIPPRRRAQACFTGLLLHSIVAMLAVLGTTGCVSSGNPCPPGQVPDDETGACAEVSVDLGAPDEGPAVPCSEPDIVAWSALHRSPMLVEDVSRCAAEAFCLPQLPCDAGECIARAAGMQGCDACAELQADCTSTRCRSACTLGSNGECRACMCDADCVAAFEVCAATRLDVCEGVHGRQFTDEERTIERPFVIRRKSGTGFTRTAVYDDTTGEWSDNRDSFAAMGWTSLATFTSNGGEYLVEFLGGCGDDTCPWRISPILASQELGRPVLSGRWSAGWDIFDVFVFEGDTYLLQYKSGSLPIADEPLGAVRVFRVVPGESPALALEEAATSIWVTPSGQAWSDLAIFALAGVPHVAQHRAGEGETTGYVRVERADGVLVLAVATGDTWLGGWEFVDAFPVGDRWFLLQYANSTGGSAGSVRISEATAGTNGTIALVTRFEADDWPEQLTRTLAFRTAAGTFLLRQSESNGMVDVLRVSDTPGAWVPDGAGSVEGTESWGVEPPWDGVALVRRRVWRAL